MRFAQRKAMSPYFYNTIILTKLPLLTPELSHQSPLGPLKVSANLIYENSFSIWYLDLEVTNHVTWNVNNIKKVKKIKKIKVVNSLMLLMDMFSEYHTY